MSQLPIGSSGQAIAVISNKYRLSRRLGGGSFGDIYLGEYIPTAEKVAIKFEKHGARCPQLRHEYKVYRELQHCSGFGKVHYFGQHDCYNVMVMELLGYSLEDLFNKCGRRFSLKTVLQLADQVLDRVETMHNRHLIHRDIKPANFVIGYQQISMVHCIDFGLSKRYRHPRTLQHIAYRDGRSLTGTPRYASINNHLGIEQSRRDDLESIGYVLVYFLRGVLPWQGLKAKTASKKYKMIMEKKQSVSISELCQGCPVQFAEYLTYCRSLSFDSKPDMQYLRGLFRDLYIQQGYSGTALEWDWDRFVTSFGGLGLAGDESLKPPATATGTNRGLVGPSREADVMDTTGDAKALASGGGGGGIGGPTTSGAQPGNGGLGGEVIMQDSTKWLPSPSRPQTSTSQQAVPEPPVVMMQTSDGDDGPPSSPLNKLRQSLRISDDDGGGAAATVKGHKRQLSLSQQGESGEGGMGQTAWGEYYKQHLGSSSNRPKTAHGTRISSSSARSNGNPNSYEVRGSSTSSRPGTAGAATNYCRKCGKVASGSSSTACGCGSTAPLTANHVVAGARGMMRYRRTRAATTEPTSGGGGDSASKGSGGVSKNKPTGSALVGRSTSYSSNNNSSNGSNGGAKSSSGKQETFFNGFLKKARSFARPTSASNMAARRPSMGVNSSSTGISSQMSGAKGRTESPMYRSSSTARKERAATAGTVPSRPIISSSKHVSGGGYSAGLAVPS